MEPMYQGKGYRIESCIAESVIHMDITEYKGAYGQMTFMNLGAEAPADIPCTKYVLCSYSSMNTPY